MQLGHILCVLPSKAVCRNRSGCMCGRRWLTLTRTMKIHSADSKVSLEFEAKANGSDSRIFVSGFS